jgi:hypothetical protein
MAVHAATMLAEEPAVAWLLESEDPSIRLLTLTDVLGKTHRSAAVRKPRDRIPHGPRVRALLRGQRLHGLLILSRMGRVTDGRAREALEVIETKRRDDGCWAVEGRYWRGVGRDGTAQEVVDWGRKGRNEFVTLNALRVLRAAHRL